MHPLLGGFIGQEQCPSGRKGAENCGAKAIVECQQPLLSVDLTQHCQHWGCTTRHLIKTKLKYLFIQSPPISKSFLNLVEYVHLEPGLDDICGEDDGPECDPRHTPGHYSPQRANVILALSWSCQQSSCGLLFWHVIL